MTDTIPMEGRDYGRLLDAMAALVAGKNAGARGALAEVFADVAAGLGAYRALLLDVDGTTLSVVAAVKVDEADQRAVVSGRSAPGVSATLIRKVIQDGEPRMVQHPVFLSPAERTGSLDGDTPSERGRNYSAICSPVVEPSSRAVRLVLYLQSLGGPDLRRAYREQDLRHLSAVTDIVSSWLAEDVPMPVMGRNYPRLMSGVSRLARDLGDQAGGVLSAMVESFEDLVAGFGAERALIVRPEYNRERVVGKLTILAHHNVTAQDLAAVSEGRSAPGISASMLRRVISSEQPELVEHPALSRGADKTAAFTEGGKVRNYSAICAPVLKPSGTLVDAIYYFQSATGHDLRRTYRDEDLDYLRAVTRLMEAVLALHHELLGQPGIEGGLKFRDLVDRYKERLIRQSLIVSGNSYSRACDNLGLNPSAFYRHLERFGIPYKRELREAEAQALAGSDENGDED